MTNTSRILDPKLVKPYITCKNWRIGAIKGSSRDKLCQELTLESLQNRRWFRKLCIFHRIVKEKSWKYLFDLTPPNSNLCKTKISQNFRALEFKVRNNFFLDSFSPLILSEWKKPESISTLLLIRLRPPVTVFLYSATQKDSFFDLLLWS